MEGNIYGFGLELGRLLACTCGNACALRRHSRTSGSARAYAWVGSGQENRPAAATLTTPIILWGKGACTYVGTHTYVLVVQRTFETLNVGFNTYIRTF